MYSKLNAFVNDTYKDIIQICAPLFKQTNIISVTYERTIGNNKKCNLVTHRDWHEYFYEQKFYETAAFFIATPDIKNQGIFSSGLHGFNGINNKQITRDKKEKFGLDNVYVYFNGYHEKFIFGGRAGDDSIINFFIQQQELLLRFICYFKNEAEK